MLFRSTPPPPDQGPHPPRGGGGEGGVPPGGGKIDLFKALVSGSEKIFQKKLAPLDPPLGYIIYIALVQSVLARVCTCMCVCV